MKFIINGNEYTAIDSLRFNPEADLSNNSLPINEFEARLFTNAIIQYGQWAELRDDLDNLWARYWLRYAERIGRDDDKETYIVRIIGQSPLAILERITLPAAMYNTTATGVLNDILTQVGQYGQQGDVIEDTTVANDFDNTTVQGFCPEQTARERLNWLLLVTGCYVKNFFDTSIRIKKIATSGGTLIPIEKTFWKPTISHRDYVTQIRVHAYTFTQGSPASTDKYVTDGVNYWIVSEQVVTMTNTNVPSGVPENVVEIDGVYLVSPSLASTILTNLVVFYFDRVETDAEIIDNADYIPGDLVTVYTDDDQLYSGYIDKIDFSFGVQARGKIHVTPSLAVDGASLHLVYKWGKLQLARRSYFLPKSYPYSITTEYLDWMMNGHRYIFRPLTATVSGTLTENTTVEVECEIALDHYRIETGALDRYYLQAEYDAMYELLSQYYAPKIREDSNAGKNLEKVRSLLSAVYGEKKSAVEQYSDFLHIINVDEATLDTSGSERTVDIS